MKKYVILAWSIFAATPLSADIESIKLRVSGVTCPYCPEGLADRASQLSGVSEVVAHDHGTLNLLLERRNTFNLAQLKPMVENRSHYKLKEINITATGRIEQKGAFYVLDIEDSPHNIYIIETKECLPKKKNAKKEKSDFIKQVKTTWGKTVTFVKSLIGFNTKFGEEIRLHHKHKATVRLSGPIHAHPDGAFYLSSFNVTLNEID